MGARGAKAVTCLLIAGIALLSLGILAVGAAIGYIVYTQYPRIGPRLAWGGPVIDGPSGPLMEGRVTPISGGTATGNFAAAFFPPTTTRTPFQPVANTSTPTPTATASPTVTATPTMTASPTPTATETATPTPPPTEAPAPVDLLPDSAFVYGVTGYAQSLPLTCEARSAADWARFFGVRFGEMEFQNGLPASDNPNKGFVGSPYGARGSIPPAPYGVHAAPVAALLRAYGLNAVSETGFRYDELRGEIAAGRPVIAWVIGNVWYGSSTWYTAADGETMLVAPYEHTVIVTGYSPSAVQVVDGELVYSADLDQFLASWAALGNMVVFMQQ